MTERISKPVAPQPSQRPPQATEAAATVSQLQASIDTSRMGQPLSSSSKAAIETPVPSQFGRYKIERELGKGAMGVVYLAEDTQLHRKVALKIPKKSALEDAEAIERFYREARTTATLRHPNICPVYDVGAIDGTHYLTMAYIPGKPVGSFLGKGKIPPAKQVGLLFRKLALALEAAHQSGVVHRDLKPSNIMFDDRNEPIVMDFGLAVQTNTIQQARLTQSGAILGTPAYMAPEQVRGELEQIGPQSDIYALGVMLYQFLTGELPFSGPIMMVFAQILTEQPQQPSTYRPDIDPTLEAICLKMMAKDKSQRYASMKDVASALTEYLKTGSVTGNSIISKLDPSVLPSAPRSESISTAAKSLAAPRARIEPELSLPGKPRRIPRVAGVLLGCLMVLCGIIVIIKRPDGKETKILSDAKQAVVHVTPDDVTIKVNGTEGDVPETTVPDNPAVPPVSFVGRVYSGEITGYRPGSVAPNSTRPFTWTITRHDGHEMEIDYVLDDVQELWRFKGHLIEEKEKNPTIVIRDIDLIDGDNPLEGTTTIVAELLNDGNSIQATGQSTNGWRSTLTGILSEQTTNHNPTEDTAGTNRRLYSIYGGRWSIDGDNLIQADADVEFAHLNFGDKSWTDYDFQVDIMRVEGRLSAGICVRLDDPQFCLFALGHGDKSLAEIHTSQKDVNGKFIWRVVADVYQPVENNVWHTVRTSVRGNHFECWMESLQITSKLFELDDDSLPSGRVGLRTVKSAFRFRNIRVTSPEGVVLWEGLPDIH